MAEIRKKAKVLGIVGKNEKAELIHAIRKAKGCTLCFAKSNGQRPQTNCCFRMHCLKNQAINPGFCVSE